MPYDPLLILGVFGLLLLLAFTITAFGVMVAVRIKQMQTFMGVMQMVVMPMFFISGALFPVAGLPAWLAVLNRIDPLTYAVDPMRQLVFDHLDISPQAIAALDPGVTWFGWRVPGLLEAAMVLRARPGDAGRSRSGSSARRMISRGRRRQVELAAQVADLVAQLGRVLEAQLLGGGEHLLLELAHRLLDLGGRHVDLLVARGGGGPWSGPWSPTAGTP